MRSGILAAGNWIVDYVKTVDVYPEQDSLANILAESESNGGSPYNVLVDLSMLGARFPLGAVGLIGDDEPGSRILEHCRGCGILCEGLRQTKNAPTSYTLVMTVEKTGRRTFFHQRGANALLSPEHFDFSKTNAKIFHLGYLLLLDKLDAPHEDGTGAANVLKRARSEGLITSIDVVSEDGSRFREVVLPALRHCDICFMNELEAERTTGIPLRSSLCPENLRKAAEFLFAHGLGRLAVIHYPEGAFVLDADGSQFRQNAVKVPTENIKSLVGSGDAFAAGFLLAFHEERSIPECLLLAVCAAAACITDFTTSGGLRSERECLNLMPTYRI